MRWIGGLALVLLLAGCGGDDAVEASGPEADLLQAVTADVEATLARADLTASRARERLTCPDRDADDRPSIGLAVRAAGRPAAARVLGALRRDGWERFLGYRNPPGTPMIRDYSPEEMPDPGLVQGVVIVASRGRPSEAMVDVLLLSPTPCTPYGDA